MKHETPRKLNGQFKKKTKKKNTSDIEDSYDYYKVLSFHENGSNLLNWHYLKGFKDDIQTLERILFHGVL